MGINFIKNIVDGAVDEHTHNKFVRFGKGTFEREPMTVKVTSKVSVKSGFEFGDAVLRFVVSHSDADVDFSGAIITSKDISPVLEKRSVEYSSRGKKWTVKGSMGSDEFMEFLKELEGTYALLSLTTRGMKVKMKTALPKPGNTSEDFLRAEFPKDFLADFAKEFLWEYEGGKPFKSALAKHTYIITDIEVPKEFENDYAMARIKAVRKGTLKRHVEIDGQSFDNDYKLEA
ncbi:hypothetical protein D6764_00425 [Candidatus Woesearchaeota archaeon]|nr:MAG: hypothetical protein D6764_00425 [Candidatus Woesearchaeota archaeon]